MGDALLENVAHGVDVIFVAAKKEVAAGGTTTTTTHVTSVSAGCHARDKCFSS
jgi:hypothetical protein